MLRLELLKVKADLKRELEDFSLNCSKCGLDVHWVAGLGVSPGHWAHREPAPHGEPATLYRQPIGTFGTRASAAASCSGSNSTSGRRSFR